MTLHVFFQVSIFKTIRLNLFYFGLKGVVHPKIIASKNVFIKELKGSVIFNQQNSDRIMIGFCNAGIVDNRKTATIWENSGEIIFGGKAEINSGASIICKGNLKIGKNFSINSNSLLICMKQIEIGEDVLISWNCQIMDSDFHTIVDLSTSKKINDDEPIYIGNHVWICSNVTILKGAEVCDDIVIGSGSTITTILNQKNCVYINSDTVRSNIAWMI